MKVQTKIKLTPRDTVQMTFSEHGGVVSEPLYLKYSWPLNSMSDGSTFPISIPSKVADSKLDSICGRESHKIYTQDKTQIQTHFH